MAGGAPIDCAQPLKHHIMAKHVHITAPGMALEAMPIMPMKALAKADMIRPVAMKRLMLQ